MKTIYRILTCALLMILAPRTMTPALARSASAPALAWDVQCLGCGKEFYNMSERSLRLDANGHAHMAYGARNLYYAWFDGTTWQSIIVDPAAGVGQAASLALDAQGYAHISYYDATNQDLKYAHQDASGWHIETIDSAGRVGSYTSLTLDGSGGVHIAYYDESNADLKYARNSGAGWQIETAVSGGDVGTYPSLVLDSGGYAHISFFHEPTYLGYTYQDASGWHNEVADYYNVSGPTSLALDGTGVPHIAYVDSADGLNYTVKNGNDWVKSTAGTSKINAWNLSLVLDSSGKAFIAYWNLTPDDLQLAVFDGSTWDVQTVDGWHDVGESPSLALDGNGYAHISYTGYGTLRYARQIASGWQPPITVDVQGTDGAQYSAMRLDDQGIPHIAFSLTGSNITGPGDLRYAWQSPMGWQVQDVYDDCGLFTPCSDISLQLDSQGRPRIIFTQSEFLRYAYPDGNGWQVENIVTTGPYDYLRGRRASLVLDAADYPHLTYITNDYKLNHLYQDASGWHEETIDDSSSYTSLAVDAGGTLHTAYVKSFKIWYAYRDNSGWHTQSLEDVSGQRWLSPTSLVLDAQGYPHIAFDKSAFSLGYLYQDAAGWHAETVLQTANSDFYEAATAIALTGSGQPRIAFYTDVAKTLNYASRGPAGWNVETVETLGSDVPKQVSLGLASGGYPRMVYGHTSQGLKIAAVLPPAFVPGICLPIIIR